MKFSRSIKNKIKPKSKNRYKSLAILSSIVCLITILLVILFKTLNFNSLFNNEFKIKNSKKEIGTIQTIEGEKNLKSYELKYPLFKSEKLNSSISS